MTFLEKIASPFKKAWEFIKSLFEKVWTKNGELTQVEISKKNEKWSTALLILPYILLFSMFIIIPIMVAMGLSLTHFDLIQRPVFTQPLGMYNYVMLITQDQNFLKYVIPNTITYAVFVGPGGYILAFLMAWMLSQIQATPRKWISLAMYTPSMLGPVFITVVWRTVFSGNQDGYINAL